VCVRTKLTVFFEEPFWVGVFERVSGGNLEVARVVFGSEPKDYDVQRFILNDWASLRFSRPVEAGREAKAGVHPKRMQRQIRNVLLQKGAGTKAQMALKLQLEEGKQVRKQKSKAVREAEARRKYVLKREKKKQKHRGR